MPGGRTVKSVGEKKNTSKNYIILNWFLFLACDAKYDGKGKQFLQLITAWENDKDIWILLLQCIRKL